MTRAHFAPLLSRVAAAAAAVLLTGCNPQPATAPSPFVQTDQLTVTSIAVQGQDIALGASATFSAIATLMDGTTRIVTSEAHWSTSDASVATAGPGGAVVGVEGGAVEIRATFGGLSGRLGVLVSGRGTYFAWVSEPGDALGLGTIGFVRGTNSILTGQLTPPPSWIVFPPGGQRITISAARSGSLTAQQYLLNVQAPVGQSVLLGTWENAELYPLQPSDIPGLAFRANGRVCTTLRGRFSVDDVVTFPVNGIDRLHITFQLRCNGRPEALRGEVSYRR